MKNSALAQIGISEIHYPAGIPLNVYRPNWFSIFGCAFITGVIFAGVLWYAMRHDENVSQLFF